MVKLFYVTCIGVDHIHHVIFCIKVGKGTSCTILNIHYNGGVMKFDKCVTYSTSDETEHGITSH